MKKKSDGLHRCASYCRKVCHFGYGVRRCIRPARSAEFAGGFCEQHERMERESKILMVGEVKAARY